MLERANTHVGPKRQGDSVNRTHEATLRSRPPDGSAKTWREADPDTLNQGCINALQRLECNLSPF
jgi:hypothetical protein